MARLNGLALLLLALCAPAHADEWTNTQIQEEIAYQLVAGMDWNQTRTIANNGKRRCRTTSIDEAGNTTWECFGYYEVNPILGKHPSVSDVDRYFLLGALSHVVVSSFLPDGWRDWWERSSIAFEVGFVANNYHLGIEVRF